MDYQKKVQDVLDAAVEAGTECGCQAAMFIDGELIVNAYAGWTDWTKTKKVDENTIFPVYSTGKAPSSTLLHRLAEQGVIRYDTRIADIWPEFGCCGKEDMRVWHVLSYRSALFEVPEASRDELADFQTMCRKMALAKPAYEIGTIQQYHARTYGWLTAGIACHATGRNDYFDLFREMVASPAGMDRFFYGCDVKESNAAYLVPALDGSSYSQACIDEMNDMKFRTSCNPSTCAMSSALSLARHYAGIDNGTLMSRETLENAVSLKWRSKDDPILLQRGRWALFGLGYVLSGPPDDVTRIFGHGGIGGSEALLDRKRHLAIALTRNCFANPNVMTDFYSAVDFKNRDWPDTAEIPLNL